MPTPQKAPAITSERYWWDQGAVVAGVDEVGRGAWAGPVTYGAVILRRTKRLYGLRDSKMLPPQRRTVLAERIQHRALGVSVGQCSNDEIDRLGMSAAMQLAARRALDGLPLRPDVCLLDGNWNFLKDAGTHNELLIRGDQRSASIAAASIAAKVARDAEMTGLSDGYPAYDFWSNKGYPTPTHLAALDRWGPCVLHRHSWRPVEQAGQLKLFTWEESVTDSDIMAETRSGATVAPAGW